LAGLRGSTATRGGIISRKLERVSGARVAGGRAIGKTSSDGRRVETEAYSSEDLMAPFAKRWESRYKQWFYDAERPAMKIANGGG